MVFNKQQSIDRFVILYIWNVVSSHNEYATIHSISLPKTSHSSKQIYNKFSIPQRLPYPKSLQLTHPNPYPSCPAMSCLDLNLVTNRERERSIHFLGLHRNVCQNTHTHGVQPNVKPETIYEATDNIPTDSRLIPQHKCRFRKAFACTKEPKSHNI